MAMRLFLLAVAALVSASLWSRAGAVVLEDAAESCQSATAVYFNVDPVELRALAQLPGDPYNDSLITQAELEWLRRYHELTGKTYQPGDLERLQRASACLWGEVDTRPSSGSPSPEPTTAVRTGREADRSCQDVAQEWMSSYGLPADGVAVLSGCRQTSGGVWFWPAGSDDPRLPGGPILTPEERRQTDGLRFTITDQLAGLPWAMPAWMVEELQSIYDPVFHPGAGHVRPDVSTGTLRPQYEAILVPYLVDPAHLALARYAYWWAASRAAAFPASLCLSMPAPVCNAVRSAVDVDRAPWPWDLADPFTLDSYLDWALVNGYAAA